MDDKWDISEGVLRGKQLSNGEWQFYQVISFDPLRDPKTFPLVAATPSEARRKASQTEAKELVWYIESRRYSHSKGSFNEGGWVGDLVDSVTGQFIVDEFDINLSTLSHAQAAQIDQDILALSGSYLTKARQQAKSDLVQTRRLLRQFKKYQCSIESLSRGFRSTAYFSPMAAPDETLARLLFELSENEKAIQENLDQLGRDKANISAIQLCENAIDIFLRWYDDTRDRDERGIRYSIDAKQLKTLPKVEADADANLPVRLNSPLGEFLEKVQVSRKRPALLH